MTYVCPRRNFIPNRRIHHRYTYRRSTGIAIFSYQVHLKYNASFVQSTYICFLAPTGSGKTAVMEIAIIRAFSVFGGDAKIIYMAPIKSLCSERAADWQRKFQNFGVTCMFFIAKLYSRFLILFYSFLSQVKNSPVIQTLSP